MLLQPRLDLIPFRLDERINGFEGGFVEVPRFRGTSVGRAMASVNRFAPITGVILPFDLVNVRWCVEPDVPSQDVPLLENIARTQVEDLHDHRVEVIDYRVIARQDRSNFHRHVGNPPSFGVMQGEVWAFDSAIEA